jgi:hypothetical protein
MYSIKKPSGFCSSAKRNNRRSMSRPTNDRIRAAQVVVRQRIDRRPDVSTVAIRRGAPSCVTTATQVCHAASGARPFDTVPVVVRSACERVVRDALMIQRLFPSSVESEASGYRQEERAKATEDVIRDSSAEANE